MKSICSFSNAKGGMVVAGISDDGRIMGFNIGNKTLEDLVEYIKNTQIH